MAKIIFTILVLIHGLIHLMGFFKAFDFVQIDQLSSSISKPVGIIWLFTALLFLTSVLLYALDVQSWPLVALPALIISQILIISVWQDAKFGTIANVVILLVCLPALGQYQFHKMVEKEKQMLMQRISIPVEDSSFAPEASGASADKEVEDSSFAPPIVIGGASADKEVRNLPSIVRKWLQNSGALNHNRIASVKLKQTGRMNTKPDGKWMDFTATQYFDVKQPAFIWNTRVRMMPLIHLTGRDKLIGGKGEMQIKLLSLIKVVDEGPNEKINKGAMLRFLAETIWFPTAALEDYMQWKEIDSLTAEATLRTSGESVSGVFRFDKNGDFQSFEADRYYGGGPDATQHPWLIEATGYKDFHGYRIPYKARVTWMLPEGDFTWLELEITEVECN